jgi:hypothetical protein
VYALIEDQSNGVPLTVAAATVLAGLLAGFGDLVESRSRPAVDLVAEGRGSLAVEAVVRTGCPIRSAESAGIRTDRCPDGMFDPGDLTVTSY